MGPTTVLLDEEKSDEEKNGNIFQMLLYYLKMDLNNHTKNPSFFLT